MVDRATAGAGSGSGGETPSSRLRRILAVGVLILLTYAMVLAAYSAGRVGYAGAIREVSVVFAALIGWRWLGEGFGSVRLVGALLIFAGIVMIAVAG